MCRQYGKGTMKGVRQRMLGLDSEETTNLKCKNSDKG